MDRRDFVEKAGCGMAGFAAAAAVGADEGEAQESRRYSIAIEIFEEKGLPCAAGHREGDRFEYPGDRGRICPWLMDSMNACIRVLIRDGTLGWLYRGTPYEKVIDKDGVTTEFIRCPDPTRSGVVAKIVRTRIP